MNTVGDNTQRRRPPSKDEVGLRAVAAAVKKNGPVGEYALREGAKQQALSTDALYKPGSADEKLRKRVQSIYDRSMAKRAALASPKRSKFEQAAAGAAKKLAGR